MKWRNSDFEDCDGLLVHCLGCTCASSTTFVMDIISYMYIWGYMSPEFSDGFTFSPTVYAWSLTFLFPILLSHWSVYRIKCSIHSCMSPPQITVMFSLLCFPHAMRLFFIPIHLITTRPMSLKVLWGLSFHFKERALYLYILYPWQVLMDIHACHHVNIFCQKHFMMTNWNHGVKFFQC